MGMHVMTGMGDVYHVIFYAVRVGFLSLSRYESISILYNVVHTGKEKDVFPIPTLAPFPRSPLSQLPLFPYLPLQVYISFLAMLNLTACPAKEIQKHPPLLQILPSANIKTICHAVARGAWQSRLSRPWRWTYWLGIR
jgi:hypothetical protein